MATRAAVISGPDDAGRVQIEWQGLSTGDDGTPVPLSQYWDKTVHSDGDYSSGSITMQGSNNAEGWFTLKDPQGNPISLSADTVGALIAENPHYIRPLVANGDGDTDLTVTISAYIPRG